MVLKQPVFRIKKKFHTKTLAHDAIYLTHLKLLDNIDWFSIELWLWLPIFDYTELGFGLLFNIPHMDFLPFALNFRFELPTIPEIEQGIWAKFLKIDYPEEYPWTKSLDKFIEENIEPEYWTLRPRKAVYGVSIYDTAYYDPPVQREFLRSSFQRLRLLRTPNVSYKKTLGHLVDFLEITEGYKPLIYNKLALTAQARSQAFILGPGVLGRSKLAHIEDGKAVVETTDYYGKQVSVKITTLDQIQFGFILGIAPLGYGALLPKKSVYKLQDGKKNPVFVDVMKGKVRSIIDRHTLTTFSYSLYQRPEEILYVEKSDRAEQYHGLFQIRRQVEDWVTARIESLKVDTNRVQLRAYKNACLQLISWRAKRNKWGYEGFGAMTEEQFKSWWIQYWEKEGLNKETRTNLYEGMEIWLKRVREDKLALGEKVKKTRKALARLRA